MRFNRITKNKTKQQIKDVLLSVPTLKYWIILFSKPSGRSVFYLLEKQ